MGLFLLAGCSVAISDASATYEQTPRTVFTQLNRSLHAISLAPYHSKNFSLQFATARARVQTVLGAGRTEGIATEQAADFLSTPVNASDYRANRPGQTAAHPQGGYVFIDNGPVRNEYRSQILWVTAGGQVIRLAGGSCQNYSGDGGPAVNACLSAAHGVTVLGDSSLLIADTFNNVIRYVNARTGRIWTVAGANKDGCNEQTIADCVSPAGPSRTPLPLNRARMGWPVAVRVAPNGSGYYVVTASAESVQFVRDFGMTTLVGDGHAGFSGDGGPAANARVNAPADIQPLRRGGFLLSDGRNCRIRRVAPGPSLNRPGIITTIIGTGRDCASETFFPFPNPVANGSSPLAAQLHWPGYISVDPSQNVYIADQFNWRIWAAAYDPLTNSYPTVQLIAGRDQIGWNGDGAASRTGFTWPSAVLWTPFGLLVSDTGANRIRLLASS